MRNIGMPEVLLEMLPRRWTRLGHVALIRLPSELTGWEPKVGNAYAKALGVATVGQVDGVHGELRQPRLRLFHGNVTETEVHEHGLRYRLDVARVMWSPGNVGWRAGTGETGDERVAALYRLDPPPATIVDMFAGVGYFALPLAREYPDAEVVAIEKNPDAFAYLNQNLALNRITNVTSRLGDCRDLPPPGHSGSPLPPDGTGMVHLGYLGGTAAFLPHALKLLGGSGGVLIYHESYPNSRLGRSRRSQWRALEPPASLVDELSRVVARAGRRLTNLQAAKVKSYAPGVTHLVARLDVS